VHDHEHAQRHGGGEHPDVDHVLARVRDRPLRDPLDFLQLPGGHEAAREREEPENHFGHDGARPEGGELRRVLGQTEEVFCGPDEAGGEPAEGVRERGPLWYGGERHEGERHADDESGDDRQDDPAVVHDLGLEPGRQHGHEHPRDARNHRVAGGLRVVHPVQ